MTIQRAGGQRRSRGVRGQTGRRADAFTAGSVALAAAPDSTRLPALRVAVLDGDSGFTMVLGKRMERAGWERVVLSARTSQKALLGVEADALVLDIANLGARRWALLARLREQRPELGVIVCSGPSTVAERVRALRLGADDWLSKPCHPEELIARIEAVSLHRGSASARDLEPRMMGEVEVRPDQFQAFVDGRSVRLTRREYQLIDLLSQTGGDVLSRERIYECLWGYEMARNDRSVDVFVHKLRRKLESASPGWSYIKTHFGIGYQLIAESATGVGTLHAEQPLEADLIAA